MNAEARSAAHCVLQEMKKCRDELLGVAEDYDEKGLSRKAEWFRERSDHGTSAHYVREMVRLMEARP